MSLKGAKSGRRLRPIALGVTSLRITTTFASLFDARLAGLVHETALEEPGMRFRHERFLVSRLAAGAVMMAALPPYLLWRGVPSGIEALGIASLFLPVLAAAVLSRTGILWIAHALSSAGLTGVVVCLAALTGGSSSAAALWLVAIPLEALVSGSIRATVAAALIAALGALAVAVAGQFDLTAHAIGWPSAIAMPLFAITAIGHISAQAIEHLRREGEWRSRMRDNEARDRLLLSAIDDLVTWHDGNGRVLEASASALKFVGTEPGRLRGLGLLDRVHIGDRPALLKAISDVAASGEPVTVPFRLHLAAPSADGSLTIFAEMRAHRIEAGLGGAAAATVVAVTRDVSEHHRHAAELDKARADAERADAVKSRFLATVTHELRTPLNAIIGFSEVLGGEGACTITAERSKEYADIIASSGRHLLGVVNTLLDMSRIQSGHFDFDPEMLDVSELVNGCCDLMQMKADGAGIRLVRGVIPHGAVLTADARACRQVLINLISNAVKFTPKGGRIEVGVRSGGNYLDLVVGDTGCGIAEADLPRIGDPFFQANGGYERAHEGTGLGLSVVRGLVGLHGGSVSIESAPGLGTTVSVTLPVEPRRSDALAEPAPIRASLRGAASADEPAPTVVRLPIGLFDDTPLPRSESAPALRKAG
ncbi:PAS domain-containing sensor histidine kinase [Methylobacterium brachythecii]|uniref:histidine kinase n=1 Tax=Methylobacterium brachythecii TaxID=1176177 RepID=A0ABQ6D3A8_9HYPH|nr:PAS domain-containing sensor histidine kinase [Methylobacterium brachythecii]